MGTKYTLNYINTLEAKAAMLSLNTDRINEWSIIITDNGSSKLFLEGNTKPIDIIGYQYAVGNHSFLIITSVKSRQNKDGKTSAEIYNTIYVHGKMTPAVSGKHGRLLYSLTAGDNEPALTYRTGSSNKVYLLDYTGKKLEIPSNYWGCHVGYIEDGFEKRPVYFLHNKFSFLETEKAWVDVNMTGAGNY